MSVRINRASRLPRHDDEPVVRMRHDAARALGDTLAQYEWHHVIDGTFTSNVGPDGALAASRTFRRNLARHAQRDVRAFVMVARGAAGRWHVHALVWGTKAMSVETIERLWAPRYGGVRVRRFDAERGACRYIGAHSADDLAEPDYPDVWPPLARSDQAA